MTEDEEGAPFVGKAGHALDQFLVDVGLKREEVYITNTAKCYGGPGDPCPSEEVFNACEAFLEQEIALVSPEIVVTLGADAYRRLTCNISSITKIQGNIEKIFWPPLKRKITVIPVTHPSFWIRSGNYYDRVIKSEVVPVLIEVLAASS